MKALILAVDHAVKTVDADGNTRVTITHGGKTYSRKVYQRYFSNYPFEYIQWNGTNYSVNTVKEG